VVARCSLDAPLLSLASTAARSTAARRSAASSMPCNQWFVCSGVGAVGRCTGMNGDSSADGVDVMLPLALRHIRMASSMREAGALRPASCCGPPPINDGPRGGAPLEKPSEDDGRTPKTAARPDDDEGRLLTIQPPGGGLGSTAAGGGGSGSTAVPKTDSRPERDSTHEGSGAPGLGIDADTACLLLTSSAFSSSDMRAPTLPEDGRVLLRPEAPAELVRFLRVPSPRFMQGVFGRGGNGSGAAGSEDT
jgi:hypothetical protein